jgi:hypothetical protein
VALAGEAVEVELQPVLGPVSSARITTLATALKPSAPAGPSIGSIVEALSEEYQLTCDVGAEWFICTRPRSSRVELPDQLSKSEADTDASKAEADAQPWATVAKWCC